MNQGYLHIFGTVSSPQRPMVKRDPSFDIAHLADDGFYIQELCLWYYISQKRPTD